MIHNPQAPRFSPLPLTRSAIPILVLLQILSLPAAEDPFRAQVRPTDPLTPAEQRKSFELPEGFEIQLVASEPDIAKPMNLAFDHRGRLWATVTVEYPHPAPSDREGRDAIKILEDTNGDGKADRITTFAEGLNIPIGLHPFLDYSVNHDGTPVQACIAWSIPNLWLFRDLDGDGRAEDRSRLYGPLGWEQDTHGMNSSFTRGLDGWLYITHGFRNDSTLRGTAGSEIVLNSGNTYRVRLDGSRAEQHTWGQVNPFGMCLDPWGNLYTADCHSSPVYQLLRGGYYPSFGKPHDGLGFAPVTIQHSHGSTAISGIAFIGDDRWPEKFQENVFIGNVMTSRVNRDRITWRGSSPAGIEKDDFVKTEDPWFRPVNIQLGPDGALYIADFYNRIIGHYEVALDHPGRDRESGRIWRVIPGSLAKQKQEPLPGLHDQDGWIKELGHPNLTRRLLATHHLADTLAAHKRNRPEDREHAFSPLKVAGLLRPGIANEATRAHALRILNRTGDLHDDVLSQSAADPSALVRNHVQRLLADAPRWNETRKRIALQGLIDREPMVQRSAAETLGLHPDSDPIRPLIHFLETVPPDDTHLRHVTRMALRNQLRDTGALDNLAREALAEGDSRAVADVCLAIESTDSATFLLRHIQRHDEAPALLAKFLRHASRFLPVERIGELASFTRQRFEKNVDLQLELFASIQKGARARDNHLDPALADWGKHLAEALLKSVKPSALHWRHEAVPGLPDSAAPWFVQQRKSADGETARFICSLPPKGERLTGILRSRPFHLPGQLKFFLAGHDGFPEKTAQRKNVVRLRDAGTHRILAEQYPPRHDTAQPVEWDLGEHQGRSGYLEIVDADNGRAYAWLAAGRFEPGVIELPGLKPDTAIKRQTAAARLARELNLESLASELTALLTSDMTALEVQAQAARALVSFRPDPTLDALTGLVGDTGVSASLRTRMREVIAANKKAEVQPLIQEAMVTAASPVQRRLAQALAASRRGAAQLIAMIEADEAPARLLHDKALLSKLNAHGPETAKRTRALTRNLPDADAELDKKIEASFKAFQPATASIERGSDLFRKNCAACHQVAGQGGLAGPQLDGIGSRGARRLIEDILDPNRFLDPGFRAENIELKDDTVLTGLPLREEGELLVIVDITGREISIAKGEIVERQRSRLSLMPGNFADLLPPSDLNHLLQFLMTH